MLKSVPFLKTYTQHFQNDISSEVSRDWSARSYDSDWSTSGLQRRSAIYEQMDLYSFLMIEVI